METTILEVSDDGLEISLTDGSKWRVNPGDVSITSCWYPTQRIRIERHILINLNTSGPDKVRATRL
jgi:hypothetical protein